MTDDKIDCVLEKDNSDENFKQLLRIQWSSSTVLSLFKKGGRGGRVQKSPPTSFSPVTSTNVRISHQDFLSFSFTLLTDWCKISSLYLLPVADYWTWTKTTLQKKPENARVTKLWSHDHIHNIIWVMWQNFVGDVINGIYGVITFISKYLFCWHHQNCNHVYYNNLYSVKKS